MTVQGEGVDQGAVSHFVRFGGCDYKCDWCDTPHAVLPEHVRRLQRLPVREIIDRLDSVGGRAQAPWVILTGGNPLLHDLEKLVWALQVQGYFTAVETQGTRFKEWVMWANRVCVSPKPPSSLMDTDLNQVAEFVKRSKDSRSCGGLNSVDKDWLFLKVVIFTPEDLDWAIKVHQMFPRIPFYLSAGNDAGKTVGSPDRVDRRSTQQVREELLDRSLWLVNEVFKRPELCNPNVKVQSQYHVLLWGNELGR